MLQRRYGMLHIYYVCTNFTGNLLCIKAARRILLLLHCSEGRACKSKWLMIRDINKEMSFIFAYFVAAF